jgi:hypothetical protein
MRRFPIGWFILALTVVAGVWGYFFYTAGELRRLDVNSHIAHSPSQIYARLLIQYDKPPLFEEEYRMQDIEGVSSFTYRVRGYNGRQVTVTAPAAAVYDVSFFFQRLVQIGVWQITNKDPRPDADAHYTIYVKQLADYKQGDRTITFTNPHYWATTAGRQYHIDLSKTDTKDLKDPNSLLKLSSTSLADPRFEEIVNGFRAFGPDEFRTNVAKAIAQVKGGK